VSEGVPSTPFETRPVNRAVLDAGYRWEERALAGPLAGGAIVAVPPRDRPDAPARERAHSIEATAELLATALPGQAIYQGTLRPPRRFYERYGIDATVVAFTDCRPDLVEVRADTDGRRLLRVTDLKVSRGLRLSHRIQAALYTLLLRDVLEEAGADGEADLSPAIWLVNDPEPTAFDIRAILPPLEQFLEHELAPLLRSPASEATWHFERRCETCDYFEHCRDGMRVSDDVSRVPGVTGHAKAFLRRREPAVTTVEQLAALVATEEGRDALEDVGSLRGRTDRLLRQVTALREERAIYHGGHSLALPVGEHVRIVFTVQTEPVGGNVYGWAVTAQGLRGLVEPNPLTAAMVAVTDEPEEIRRVERELVRTIHRVLAAVHAHNVAHEEDWKAQKTLQAFTYDTYEDAILTGVLVRALSDPEVAEEALAVFFHFQRPELMEASEHPASEAPIPVVVLGRVVTELVALPLEVTYRFPEVAALLPRSERPFAYSEHAFFDYELSNQLRPDAVFSLWHEGRLDRVEWIENRLKARAWAVSSLVDGFRQHLEAEVPGTLFAWPPRFRLPGPLGFRHPLLSRLAFVVQYESTLAYLETRSARMRPLEERLRTGVTVELESEGGGLFRIASGGDDVRIDEDRFPKWILTPATPEGERAALTFPDYQFRARMWAPAKLPVALAGIEQLVTDEIERPVRLRLSLKASQAFPAVVPGARFRLDVRFTDYNSERVIEELREVDREEDPAYVRMIEDPETASGLLEDSPRLREAALELARQHGMTPSQLAAFEAVIDRGVALTWGPPGTGKTHFLALAILCLAEAHRRAGETLAVVVSGFTHAAIDNCLRKVVEVGRATGIPAGGMTVGKLGRIELAGMAGVEVVEPTQAELFFDSAPIAVLGGTVWALRKGLPVERADLVVIDEGSQLKVPEAAIAVRRLRTGGRLVVAGDHLQLPPIVQGLYPEPAEDEPLLHRSIFEALMGRGGESGVATSLLENFRMNGTLCRYPADQIYDPRYDSVDDATRGRRLSLAEGAAGGDLADLLVDPGRPLVVAVIDGVQATAENRLEAGLVADVALRLRERLLASDGAPYRDDAAFWARGLFIVSPHHAQIHAIRRALAERRRWSGRPFVGTVDRMQGQECDAVVVSYGVSDVEYALGEQQFIYSLNRLNVSITRGRAKTIVFLSRALTEPPVQAFADDRNAAGIAFMQGLVRHAVQHGEERTVDLGDGATLRLLRVAAS
jgi:DNA replication ATP-dependent helicase Dna2